MATVEIFIWIILRSVLTRALTEDATEAVIQKDVLKYKIRALLLVISCLATAPVVSVNAADESFVAHTPNVLVTPDNLPVLSWDDPGVDTEIDPSDLNQLDLCTPGACPQAALDGGAAY